jgi:phosphatidate cytidylyltransferase
MKTRAITGFFFVIVMLGSMLLGPYVFGAYFLILSSFCLFEFYGLVNQNTTAPNVSEGIGNGALLFITFALLNYAGVSTTPILGGIKTAHLLMFLIPLASSTIFIKELFKKSQTPFNNIAYTYLGLIFVCMPFIFFHTLGYVHGNFNFHFPLAFMVLLWANDTGAYLTGRQFGLHKLFERHSPKKTWEGFIGGIFSGCIAAYVFSLYYKELPWYQWMVVAVLISVFGTLGDLIESMFKRGLNIKDSGGI